MDLIKDCKFTITEKGDVTGEFADAHPGDTVSLTSFLPETSTIAGVHAYRKSDRKHACVILGSKCPHAIGTTYTILPGSEGEYSIEADSSGDNRTNGRLNVSSRPMGEGGEPRAGAGS
jgi:hypothetical protein